LARFDAEGVLDQGFVPPAPDGSTLALQAVGLQPDGNIIIGGNFLSLQGANQRRVGLLYGSNGLRPFITSAARLSAVRGSDFAHQITLSGDATVPATVTVSSGALPTGVTLQSAQRRLVGKPNRVGTFLFTLRAVRAGLIHELPVTMVVQAAPVAPIVAKSAGKYHGLLQPAALNAQKGGTLELEVNNRGTVSGTLTMNGVARMLEGKVDATGRLRASTPAAPGQPVFLLDLAVERAGATNATWKGTVSRGKATAEFTAVLPQASAAQSKPFAGKHRFALVLDGKLAAQAGLRKNSSGSGLLTVSPNGVVSISGTLPDGTPFSWGGRLRTDGSVAAIFEPRSTDQVSGVMRLVRSRGKFSAQGSLTWLRSGSARQSGFQLTLQVQPPR
jgi:hypothetical protein